MSIVKRLFAFLLMVAAVFAAAPAMTALAADAQRRQKGVAQLRLAYPVKGSTQIYKGSIVAVDAAGYLIKATDTAGLKVVGVAEENVNNTGADGAKDCPVISGINMLFAASSITQAMLGGLVYVVDDNTVDDAAGPTNDIAVGRITEFVSTTSCWVFIPPAGIIA